jgi:hypothetical protein
MVMVLPALIVGLLVIVQVGGSCIRQAEVIVDAREEAWRERDTKKGDNPFDFDKSTGGDRIEKTKSKDVNFSSISPLFPSAKAKHTLSAGTWSHPAVDLNEQPNFGLALKLAKLGPVQEAKGRLADIERLIQAFEKIKEVLENLRFNGRDISAFVSSLKSMAADQDWRQIIGDAIADQVTNMATEQMGSQSGYGQIVSLIDKITMTQGKVKQAEEETKQKIATTIDDAVQLLKSSGMGFDATSQQKAGESAKDLDTESKSTPDLAKDDVKLRIEQELAQIKKQSDDFLTAGENLKEQVNSLFRAEEMADKHSVNAASKAVRDRFVKEFPNLTNLHKTISDQVMEAHELLKKGDAKGLQMKMKDLSQSATKLQQAMASLDQRRRELIDVLNKSK